MYLLLSIICCSLLFILFKIISNKNISSLYNITINYLTGTLIALIIGIATHNELIDLIKQIITNHIILLIILNAIIFITVFIIINHSSIVAGLSVTTMASKTSVIFPVMLSLFIDPSDNINYFKITSIVLALIGIYLAVYKKNTLKKILSQIKTPLLLFFISGISDSLFRFIQYYYINDKMLIPFTLLLFFATFICGIILLIIKRQSITLINRETLLYGIILGILNYLAIYFFIIALSSTTINSNTPKGSIIFSINNIGIVCLSAFVGILIFKEQLNIINWIGIVISCLSILLLTYT